MIGSRRRRAILLGIGAMGLMVSLGGTAQAATFTVNSTGDPGTGACDASECTLREAITAANANGPSGVDQIPINATGSMVVTSQLPAIQSPTDIIGPGAGIFRLSAACLCPLFDVQSTLPGVSISGLATVGDTATPFQVGGGFVLRLSGVEIGNSGIFGFGHGGGIFNAGNLTILDSTIGDAYPLRNVADSGGAIYNDSSGSLTMARTTIANNIADTEGGAITNLGSANISDSTISGNWSRGGGGGITNHGALTLTNSTVSGNIADDFGGAIDNFGANATTSLNSVTIAGNSANNDNDNFGDGGGTQSGSVLPARVSATNTLYYGNTVGGAGPGPQCSGYDTTSGGYNLRSSADVFCTGFTGPGDIVNNGFTLGPLAANGGPTLTLALPAGAAAIDAGGNCPASDQRGLPRGGSNGGCDIGAFEVQKPPPNATATRKCRKKKRKKHAGVAKKKKKCKKKHRHH